MAKPNDELREAAWNRVGPGEIEPIHLVPTAGNAYDAETVDLALLTCAMVGGNYRRASDLLAARGVDVPKTTIQKWSRIQYPNRYRDLADRHAAAIEGRIVARVREIVTASWDVTADAIDLARERIESGDVKDPALAAKALASASAIATDRLLLLTDRPTTITQERSVEQVLNSLKRFQKQPPAASPDGLSLEVRPRELPAAGSSAPSLDPTEARPERAPRDD